MLHLRNDHIIRCDKDNDQIHCTKYSLFDHIRLHVFLSMGPSWKSRDIISPLSLPWIPDSAALTHIPLSNAKVLSLKEMITQNSRDSPTNYLVLPASALKRPVLSTWALKLFGLRDTRFISTMRNLDRKDSKTQNVMR